MSWDLSERKFVEHEGQRYYWTDEGQEHIDIAHENNLPLDKVRCGSEHEDGTVRYFATPDWDPEWHFGSDYAEPMEQPDLVPHPSGVDMPTDESSSEYYDWVEKVLQKGYQQGTWGKGIDTNHGERIKWTVDPEEGRPHHEDVLTNLDMDESDVHDYLSINTDGTEDKFDDVFGAWKFSGVEENWFKPLADGDANVSYFHDPDNKTVTIGEFGSHKPGGGTRALQDLREQYPEHQIAPLDISRAEGFWQKMHQRGLVDNLLDENGAVISKTESPHLWDGKTVEWQDAFVRTHEGTIYRGTDPIKEHHEIARDAGLTNNQIAEFGTGRDDGEIEWYGDSGNSRLNDESRWTFGKIATAIDWHTTLPDPHQYPARDGSMRILGLDTGEYVTGYNHHQKLMEELGLQPENVTSMGTISGHTNEWMWFDDDEQDMRKRWTFGKTAYEADPSEQSKLKDLPSPTEFLGDPGTVSPPQYSALLLKDGEFYPWANVPHFKPHVEHLTEIGKEPEDVDHFLTWNGQQWKPAFDDYSVYEGYHDNYQRMNTDWNFSSVKPTELPKQEDKNSDADKEESDGKHTPSIAPEDVPFLRSWIQLKDGSHIIGDLHEHHPQLVVKHKLNMDDVAGWGAGDDVYDLDHGAKGYLTNNWNFSKVADNIAHDLDWTQGNYGKGFKLNDGKMVTWNTGQGPDSSPNHWDMLKAYDKPGQALDVKDVEHHFWIDPNGSIEGGPADEQETGEGADALAQELEQLGSGSHSVGYDDSWTFSRVAINQKDIDWGPWQKGREGRALLLHDGTVHTWNADQGEWGDSPYHIDALIHHGLDEARSHAIINPRGYVNETNQDYEARQVIADAIGGKPNQASWSFSKTADAVAGDDEYQDHPSLDPWTPGEYGRQLTYPDGVYRWGDSLVGHYMAAVKLRKRVEDAKCEYVQPDGSVEQEDQWKLGSVKPNSKLTSTPSGPFNMTRALRSLGALSDVKGFRVPFPKTSGYDALLDCGEASNVRSLEPHNLQLESIQSEQLGSTRIGEVDGRLDGDRRWLFDQRRDTHPQRQTYDRRSEHRQFVSNHTLYARPDNGQHSQPYRTSDREIEADTDQSQWDLGTCSNSNANSIAEGQFGHVSGIDTGYTTPEDCEPWREGLDGKGVNVKGVEYGWATTPGDGHPAHYEVLQNMGLGAEYETDGNDHTLWDDCYAITPEGERIYSQARIDYFEDEDEGTWNFASSSEWQTPEGRPQYQPGQEGRYILGPDGVEYRWGHDQKGSEHHNHYEVTKQLGFDWRDVGDYGYLDEEGVDSLTGDTLQDKWNFTGSATNGWHTPSNEFGDKFNPWSEGQHGKAITTGGKTYAWSDPDVHHGEVEDTLDWPEDSEHWMISPEGKLQGYDEYIGDNDVNDWRFASADRVLDQWGVPNWEHGQDGKALVDPQGEVHVWGDPAADGHHHFQVMQALRTGDPEQVPSFGGNDFQEHYQRSRGKGDEKWESFQITPRGHAVPIHDGIQDPKALEKVQEHVNTLNPRLPPLDDPDWHFGHSASRNETMKFVEHNGKKYWEEGNDLFHMDIVERNNLDPNECKTGRKRSDGKIEYWDDKSLSDNPNDVGNYVFSGLDVPEASAMIETVDGRTLYGQDDQESHFEISQRHKLNPEHIKRVGWQDSYNGIDWYDEDEVEERRWELRDDDDEDDEEEDGVFSSNKLGWQFIDDGIAIADVGDEVDGSKVIEVDNLTHHLEDGRILPADSVFPVSSSVTEEYQTPEGAEPYEPGGWGKALVMDDDEPNIAWKIDHLGAPHHTQFSTTDMLGDRPIADWKYINPEGEASGMMAWLERTKDKFPMQEEQKWNFSSVQEYLTPEGHEPYEQGQEGRYLRLDDEANDGYGTEYAWKCKDGFPMHQEIINELGIGHNDVAESHTFDEQKWNFSSLDPSLARLEGGSGGSSCHTPPDNQSSPARIYSNSDRSTDYGRELSQFLSDTETPEPDPNITSNIQSLMADNRQYVTPKGLKPWTEGQGRWMTTWDGKEYRWSGDTLHSDVVYRPDMNAKDWGLIDSQGRKDTEGWTLSSTGYLTPEGIRPPDDEDNAAYLTYQGQEYRWHPMGAGHSDVARQLGIHEVDDAGQIEQGNRVSYTQLGVPKDAWSFSSKAGSRPSFRSPMFLRGADSPSTISSSNQKVVPTLPEYESGERHSARPLYRWLPASVRDAVQTEGMTPHPATGNPMHFWDNRDNADRYGEIVNSLEPHDLWEVDPSAVGKLKPDPWFEKTRHEWGDKPGAWASDAEHIPSHALKHLARSPVFDWEDQWVFDSAEHSPKAASGLASLQDQLVQAEVYEWTPGALGKGIILKDGTVLTWTTHDGLPHHDEVGDVLWPEANWPIVYFIDGIGPDGEVEVPPEWNQQAQAAGLKPVDNVDWHFGAAQVPHQDILDANGGQDLAGLPNKVNIPGEGKMTWRSHGGVQQLAKDYMQQTGLPYAPPNQYKPVDPKQAARVAQEYEKMPHDPNHPDVKASYNALAQETKAQYDHAVKNGYKFEFYPGHDPYPDSPRQAILDLHHNKHMYVYPTHDGYGSGDDTQKDHPLLGDSGVKWNGQQVTHNDLFRAVHDFYGHGKEGVGFRASGEDNAWQAHAAMFSPQARPAMTSETRGQNSWVNFGPHGEHNQTATAESTVFADQKAGLLPSWTADPNIHDNKPVTSAYLIDHPHEDEPLHEVNHTHRGKKHWNFSKIAGATRAQLLQHNDEGWTFSRVASTRKNSEWDWDDDNEEEGPEDLYHVAPTSERARILQHGLQPSRPVNNERWYEGESGPSKWLRNQPHGVYAETTPEQAYDTWATDESSATPQPGKWDTWRIPWDEHKGDLIEDPVTGAWVIPGHTGPVGADLHEGPEHRVQPDFTNDPLTRAQEQHDPKELGLGYPSKPIRQPLAAGESSAWRVIPGSTESGDSAWSDEEDETYTHHPFVTDADTNTVYLGVPGTHHADLYNEFKHLDDNAFDNPNINEGLLYEDGRGKWGYEGSTDPHAQQAVRDHTGIDFVDTSDDWKFSKVAEVAGVPWDDRYNSGEAQPWESGQYGKALIHPNGQVHHWQIDPSSGAPHHVAAMQGLLQQSRDQGAEDREILNAGQFLIHPDGTTDINKDYWPKALENTPFTPDKGWKFTKVAVTEPPYPGKGEYSAITTKDGRHYVWNRDEQNLHHAQYAAEHGIGLDDIAHFWVYREWRKKWENLDYAWDDYDQLFKEEEEKDSWSFSKTAGVQNGNQGGGTIRPWNKGIYGKGIYLDGDLHLWNSEDAHHDDIFDTLRGRSGDEPLPGDRPYAEYFEAPKIHVAPDGEILTNLNANSRQEDKGTGTIQYREPEELAAMHPDLHVKEQEDWNFSKVARDLPEVIDKSDMPHGESQWDNVHENDQAPVVHYPGENKVVVGAPGHHHTDIDDRLTDHDSEYGRITADGTGVFWYEPHNDEDGLASKALGLERKGPSTDFGTRQWDKQYDEAVQQNRGEDWHFSSNGHSLAYDGEGLGKGLITDNSEVHTWNTDQNDGYPTHGRYKDDIYQNTGQGLFSKENNEFWIDDGKVSFYRGTGGIQPMVDHLNEVDPSLTVTDVSNENWNFAKVAVSIGQHEHGAYELGANGRKPVVYYPDAEHIQVGPEGSMHSHAIAVADKQFRPEKTQETYAAEIHDGKLHWYDEGPISEEAKEVAEDALGIPRGSEDDFHFGSGFKVFKAGEIVREGEALPKEYSKQEIRQLVNKGCPPGAYGKAIETGNGIRYEWQTDNTGNPHHMDVEDAIPGAEGREIVIEPSGHEWSIDDHQDTWDGSGDGSDSYTPWQFD